MGTNSAKCDLQFLCSGAVACQQVIPPAPDVVVGGVWVCTTPQRRGRREDRMRGSRVFRGSVGLDEEGEVTDHGHGGGEA